MFQFAKQPQSILKLIGDSLRLYRDSFAKIWYALAGCFAVGLVRYFGLVQTIIAPSSVTPKPSNTNMILHPTFSSLMLSALELLLILVIVYFLFFLVMHRMQNLSKDPNISWQKSFLAMKKNFFKMLLSQLFIILFVIILAAPAGVIKIAMVTALTIFIEIFAILLISFVAPIILFEQEKIFSAFKKSILLVWGKWWRTFLVLLWAPLIAIILFFLLVLAFNSIFVAHKSSNIFTLVLMLGTDLFHHFVLLPLGIAAILVQFNDLKLRSKNKLVKNLK